MIMRFSSYITIAAAALALTACKADENDPGLEYAPQMYHSVAYDPLSQITEDGIPDGPISSWYYKTNSTPYNDYKGKQPMNMRLPVEGTVARQSYAHVADSTGKALLFYNLHKDSLDMAARILQNPLRNTPDVVEKGKHLYLGFCAPCHGEKGDGQGKVGQKYGGVPNYSAGRYATLSEGHIFHVITHGKGRMWSHKSQVNPEERWMIVRYVQKLQKGEQ